MRFTFFNVTVIRITSDIVFLTEKNDRPLITMETSSVSCLQNCKKVAYYWQWKCSLYFVRFCHLNVPFCFTRRSVDLFFNLIFL